MKVYISADIEGITGTTVWDEADRKHADYPEFREQMTAEVAAACEGALSAGASEVWVKDAHASGRNLIASRLPAEVHLMRGWSGHPLMMVEGLDASFSALLMIGYHSRAGASANPLAHTITGADAYLRINEQLASEFLLNTYAASLAGVPVAFLSGDAGICEEASALIPGLETVAVKQGLGSATWNIHPQKAVDRIRAATQGALSADFSAGRVRLPDHFRVEIRYKDHAKAYKSSFYPGARFADEFTIRFEASDYFEVLRLVAFVL